MSTPPLNPPSMRFPFESQISNLPPEQQHLHRASWNAITDIYQSINALNTKVTTVQSAASSSSSSASSNSSLVTKSQMNAAISAAISGITGKNIGYLNNQVGQTSYTTQQSDYGGFVLVNDASPIAISLAVTSSLPGVNLPWYTSIINEGTGTATITPVSGKIGYLGNVAASSMPLPSGYYATITFDGTNFFAITCPISTGGTITSVIAGTGLTGGGSSGAVTLSIAPTAVTPGSYTNTNLTVNAEGQLTAAANGSGGSSYLKGSVTINFTGGAGVYLGNTTIGGASGTMPVVMCAPTTSPNAVLGAQFIDLYADIDPGTGIIYCSANYIGGGSGIGNVTFGLVVFP